MYKRNKNNSFGFFGPTRINLCSYVSPFTMENQSYIVLYGKLFDKLFDFYLVNPKRIDLIPTYLHS